MEKWYVLVRTLGFDRISQTSLVHVAGGEECNRGLGAVISPRLVETRKFGSRPMLAVEPRLIRLDTEEQGLVWIVSFSLGRLDRAILSPGPVVVKEH